MPDNNYPFYPEAGDTGGGAEDILQQIQEMKQGKPKQVHPVLAALGLSLAKGLGDALSAHFTPQVFQQGQENLRTKMQLEQQLQMHGMLSAYEKARLAQEAQTHADAQRQQDFENRAKLVGGIANGTLQQAPAEGTVLPGMQQQAVIPPQAAEGGDILSQLQGLPQKQLSPTLAQAPKPFLSAGGMSVNPVPGATEKDLVDFDVSKLDKDSELGKQFKAAGITGTIKLPATEVFKHLQDTASKMGVAKEKLAEQEAERAALDAKVQQGLKDIDARFSDDYYKNLYGTVDPNRDLHKQQAISRLQAAQAEDHARKGGTSVTQALKDFQSWQSPWEKAKEKAEARNAQNAEILSRAATTREAQEQQHVAQGWDARHKEIQDVEKPIADWAARYGRLKESIDSRTPIADALAIPELMTVMAGGMGSGLRMSEAELNRIAHGRSKWQDLIAAFNKWQTDPSKALSITDSQRGQISDLLNAMGKKMRAKADTITAARSALADAQTVKDQHRVIDAFHTKLMDLDFPRQEEDKSSASGGSGSVEPDYITVDGKVVKNPKKGK